ncbi:MAG TPA: polysaccharide biosynthesis/export family protein [Longimicrobiales bacterium]
MKINFVKFAAVLMVAVSAQEMAAQNSQPPGYARPDSLQVGDVLKLRIWREPDLSGEFMVPAGGVIVFPKIGPRKVTGQPTAELRDALIAEYQKYLRNPSIEITFLRRVNVLGAVRQPGVYSLDPTMTIAMAVAMAGGLTPDGNPDRVELQRDGQRLEARISQRTTIAELPIQSGDQLYVRERSWASRNSGVLMSGGLGLLSIAITAIAVFRN